jgi:hypothetical protein
VDANHSILAKMFEEEIKNPLRIEVERQPAKNKNQMDIYNAIFNSFATKEPF